MTIPDENLRFNHQNCAVCKDIPNYQTVEILHTNNRLPKQIDKLVIIGGSASINQLRKCPLCGTYYIFIHDHDSESGVGYGSTDETIRRIVYTDAIKQIKEKLNSFEETKELKKELEYLVKNNENFMKIMSKIQIEVRKK
ncbi:MAG: hypothetical protein ACTSR8_04450 [Promethearchaeota archaeon]